MAEAFSETWVPLTSHDGTDHWKKLDNRRVHNEVFGVVRDAAARKRVEDGRSTLPRAGLKLEARPFGKPILVARSPSSGFALVFLCDPTATTLLGGQYHTWDTAHDWCFGFDLVGFGVGIGVADTIVSASGSVATSLPPAKAPDRLTWRS